MPHLRCCSVPKRHEVHHRMSEGTGLDTGLHKEPKMEVTVQSTAGMEAIGRNIIAADSYILDRGLSSYNPFYLKFIL